MASPDSVPILPKHVLLGSIEHVAGLVHYDADDVRAQLPAPAFATRHALRRSGLRSSSAQVVGSAQPSYMTAGSVEALTRLSFAEDNDTGEDDDALSGDVFIAPLAGSDDDDEQDLPSVMASVPHASPTTAEVPERGAKRRASTGSPVVHLLAWIGDHVVAREPASPSPKRLAIGRFLGKRQARERPKPSEAIDVKNP